MKKKLQRYKIIAFAGIIIIALGVTFSTTMKDSDNSIGTVLIAIGGLFLISGLSQKRKSNKEKE